MATPTLAPADRHYGAKVNAVEPGGAEAIPLAERHGKPLQLLWTWTSPNMEFATVFVGVICVLFFGLRSGRRSARSSSARGWVRSPTVCSPVGARTRASARWC